MIRRASVFVVVLLLTVVGLSALAGPATAAKPIQISQHRIGFECPFLSDDTSTVFLAAFDDDVEGDDGFVEYWIAPDSPDEGEGTFRSTTDPAQVTATGYHIDAVIPMEDRGFTPVGNAVVSADLETAGEPSVGPGKSRFGNQTIRDNSVEQPLVVSSGTLTLFDGRTYDLAGCSGAELTIDIRMSNPDQFVIEAFEGILFVCDVATEDYFLNLAASTDDRGTAGEVFFTSGAGTFGGFNEGFTLTQDEFSATFPLIDFETEEPAGDAVVDVRFPSRHPLNFWVVNSEGVRSKFVGSQLQPEGSITIPTEPATVVDLSTCFAFAGKQQDIQHRPDEEPEE